MLTIPDMEAKAECFLFGHDWRNGRCANCGEVRDVS